MRFQNIPTLIFLKLVSTIYTNAFLTSKIKILKFIVLDVAFWKLFKVIWWLVTIIPVTWITKTELIQTYFPSNLLKTSEEFPKKLEPVQVDNDEMFNFMMDDLKQNNEFIIDTESHQDSSFLPFVACFQITTPLGREYVVYVPRRYTQIREKLVPVLTAPKSIIVGFAMKGETAFLKNEFGMFPVAVFCLQTFMVKVQQLAQMSSLVDYSPLSS
ncbi:unnamed protein product [Allacma fusca]|uniref:3'-5' exonuclease domain-containing protein n=1 Tax=Allacma fusca TaxID=39272 RepID=A0A8J2KDF2_9HEXA|nr:unnamed protein product [Allacma fusca]